MTSQNRTKVIQIRVTEEELAKAEQLAVLQGITVSELFRECIINQSRHQLVPTMSRQTLLHLTQVYDSIKLINKKLKLSKSSDGEVSTELKKIQNLIQQLYHKIIT